MVLKRVIRGKNLRLSCSEMRIFSWSRTVLRMMASLLADIFLSSDMV
jgi:hypothetical protein